MQILVTLEGHFKGKNPTPHFTFFLFYIFRWLPFLFLSINAFLKSDFCLVCQPKFLLKGSFNSLQSEV